jgi:hypothetical protein
MPRQEIGTIVSRSDGETVRLEMRNHPIAIKADAASP